MKEFCKTLKKQLDYINNFEKYELIDQDELKSLCHQIFIREKAQKIVIASVNSSSFD